jgi:hypothetical protein
MRIRTLPHNVLDSRISHTDVPMLCERLPTLDTSRQPQIWAHTNAGKTGTWLKQGKEVLDLAPQPPATTPTAHSSAHSPAATTL